MNAGRLLRVSLILIHAAATMVGCTNTGRAGIDEQAPWSINVPELSVRLITNDTLLETGRYPICIMEVMNTSDRTILLRKDFSLNGPLVHDEMGKLMPQRRHLELKADDTTKYHRLEAGRRISIKAKPNFRIDRPGRYRLSFAVHQSWWGFEDPNAPGRMVEKDFDEGLPAVSNEVTVTFY